MRFRSILGKSGDFRADVFFQFIFPKITGIEIPLTLDGFLSGPTSTSASTLPIHQSIKTYSHKVADNTVEIVGHVVLTEPAFWTPSLPMLYTIKCKIMSAAREVISLHQTIGLRRFGIRNHSLWLDGHRFVVRGITCGKVDSNSFDKQISTAKEQNTTEIIDLSSDGSCSHGELPKLDSHLQKSDETGRPTIIRIQTETCSSAMPNILCTLANHPSVFITVIPPSLLPELENFTLFKGTMLFAIEVSGESASPEIPSGIDVAIVQLTNSEPEASWKKPPSYPIIAWNKEFASQRQECDRLQAALANWRNSSGSPPSTWDWAGFLVGN